jgi:hypothetical protein
MNKLTKLQGLYGLIVALIMNSKGSGPEIKC